MDHLELVASDIRKSGLLRVIGQGLKVRNPIPCSLECAE